jgi:hypothetical protein
MRADYGKMGLLTEKLSVPAGLQKRLLVMFSVCCKGIHLVISDT